MVDLAAGVRTFRAEGFPRRADLFAHLGTNHAPGALFIGCSDARVVPELITTSEPGDVFVIRTAGNVVPSPDAVADGVIASIEYAVGVLGVAEIVVCGHSACGAMTAVATGQDLSALPSLQGWLTYAARPNDDESVAPRSGDPVADLVRGNVAVQIDRLATIPAVREALEADAVTLRGWVFDIGTGAVEEISTSGGPADLT